MKLIWRLLPIVLCVTAVAQNSSTIAHAPIYITHVVVIDTETGSEGSAFDIPRTMSSVM
jgi:hypothetical protein